MKSKFLFEELKKKRNFVFFFLQNGREKFFFVNLFLRKEFREKKR